MENIKKIINEEILDAAYYKKIGRQRLYKIRKEIMKINPDLGINMSSQGSSWVDYWLVDKSNDELIVSYSNESKDYISYYSDEEFNEMINKFKKGGQSYLNSGRDPNGSY